MFNVYNKKKGRGAAKTVFPIPVLGCLLGVLLSLHVKSCHLRDYFRFCVKKFVSVFGGNEILSYFCTRFPALRRLVEHLKKRSLKEFHRLLCRRSRKSFNPRMFRHFLDCYSVSSMFSCKREVQESSNSFFTFNSLNQKKEKMRYTM